MFFEDMSAEYDCSDHAYEYLMSVLESKLPENLVYLLEECI